MASSSKWREVIQKASLEAEGARKGTTEPGEPPAAAATKKEGGVIAVPRPPALPRSAKASPAPRQGEEELAIGAEAAPEGEQAPKKRRKSAAADRATAGPEEDKAPVRAKGASRRKSAA